MEEISFQCSPEEARNSEFISDKLKQEFIGEKNQKIYFLLKKRSIDSRKRAIKINLNFLVSLEEFSEAVNFDFDFKNVKKSESIHIIGAGPAGLFAALRALERGFKPIIFERGKDVRERRRDLAILNKEGRVNSESNYCFGEGGAGTYSDGKLYTRSKKRGDVERILQMLVYFGANEDILVEEFISGREVTCGVIVIDGKPTALPITEIVSENEFFDFQAKYEGKSQEITPAPISSAHYERVQNLAARIYSDLNCGGMIRVDFLLPDEEPCVIEVNTVPGFSAASIIPQQAAAMGMDKTTLITTVIDSSL